MENKFYGLEDYTVQRLNCRIILNNELWPYFIQNWGNSCTIFHLDNAEEIVTRYNCGVVEHKEALDSAKTLYIHPSCTIPRTLVFQKYKKTLNPWLADAVVLPETVHVNRDYYPVFINEDAKLVVIFDIPWEKSDVDFFKNMKNGSKVKEVMRAPQETYKLLDRAQYINLKVHEMLEAEYDGLQSLLFLGPEGQYLAEYYSDALPKSKIVFEKTVLESLGNDDNKFTLESAISIYEMLCSPDHDTVGSAIKAMAAMDYIHYPNTVKAVLKEAPGHNWRYHKATSSTLAKAMFKVIGNKRRLSYDDKFISKDDYNLMKQFLEYCYKDNSYNSLQYMYQCMSFMYQGEDLNYYPRIRD